MQIFQSWFTGYLKNRPDAQRTEGLQCHDRLADWVLALASGGSLKLTDDFSLRFELMVLNVSVAMFLFQKEGQPERADGLWELMLEGFDYSLRQRGVTDIRIGARMRKLYGHGVGRRMAYWQALSQSDLLAFRQAIARNVLNGCSPEDDRVTLLLNSLSENFSLHKWLALR